MFKERVIDPALLPLDGPPVARPLRMAEPVLVSEVEVVATTADEEVLEADLPVVVDPTGRVVRVDDRLLTEAMFFRLGFSRATLPEMSAACMASVMWIGRVMTAEPWLAEAYKAGYDARDQQSVVTAARSLDELVSGYTLDQQKVTKDGDVVDYKQAVGASVEAVKFQLSSRDKDRYGKEAKAAAGVVTIGVMVNINDRLAQAGMPSVDVQVKQ